ncbi:MAG: tripartite tricarboxylate transporter substrate binding protein [Burkholderiales bacterium]
MTRLMLHALGATALMVCAVHAAAQTYPSRPITIVVGFSAGGTTDIIARIVGEELRQAWGQSIVIENRSGAGGNIAAQHVARAKPDGYTLLTGSVGPLAANASLYAAPGFDNLKDLQPITLFAYVPNVVVVNPKAMAVTNFAEFMALVRANPGKYNYASTGSGTTSHLSGELLQIMSGVKITHVPYKGAVAVNDLLSGEQIHFMFATIPSVIQHVRSGKLRALAVSSLARSAGIPDVPSIAELGFPGFDASSWFGLVGPAGMPRDVVVQLQTEVARAFKRPAVRDKMIQQGADPSGNTPEEFGAYMRAETEKWAKVIKSAGLKAD